MLNTGQILDQIQHGIGATPDSRFSLISALNRAGRELTTEHPWTWRQGLAQIAAVANQEYIDLPDDFGRLDTVRLVRGSGSFGVRIANLDDIERYREAIIPYPTPLWLVYPLTTRPANNYSEQARPTMQIWPTPTTDGTPTLRIQYQRVWRRLDINDLGAIPNIPDEFEAALVYKARAIALAMQEQSDSIENALYQRELVRLKAEQLEQVINYGPIKGGAREMERIPVQGFTQLVI